MYQKGTQNKHETIIWVFNSRWCTKISQIKGDQQLSPSSVPLDGNNHLFLSLRFSVYKLHHVISHDHTRILELRRALGGLTPPAVRQSRAVSHQRSWWVLTDSRTWRTIRKNSKLEDWCQSSFESATDVTTIMSSLSQPFKRKHHLHFVWFRNYLNS